MLIGKSQREQIRKSLRDACEHFSPRLWVLCVNMDLDTKAHRWFQALQSSYSAKGTKIELVQGSDIVHELIFRRTLRAHYFPGALILDDVRKLIQHSEKSSDNQLELAPGEDLEEYVERLTTKDPRFQYEVTYGGERGPDAFPPPPEPGIVAAITDGQKTTKAYARDAKALALDPVGFSMTLTGTGIDKMDALIRTGHAQQFGAEEICEFEATLPLLSELTLVPGEFGLVVQPSPTIHAIPLRLSLSAGNERVTYELLDFYVTRMGTDEVEISTRNERLPIEIRFIFPMPNRQTSTCKAHITKRFAGKDVCDVRKAASLLRLLEAGSEIELYSLTHEKKLAVIGVAPFRFDLPPQTVAWLDMLVAISEKFSVSIKLPESEHIGRQEYESVRLLHAIATGGALPIDSMRFTLVKSVENVTSLPELLRIPRSLTMIYPGASFKLFGTEIYHGGCGIYLEKFEFIDPNQTLLDFEGTEMGKGVPLSIRTSVPVRFFRTTRI